MKKGFLTLCYSLSALFVSSTAQADDFAVTLQGGTSGLGAGLVYGLTETVNLRASYNYLTFDVSESTDDFDYDLELKLATAELLVDWHVFRGRFRLSGGLMHNGNGLQGRGTPSPGLGTVELGGQFFNASDIGYLDADIGFRSVAPYVGIGWGNALMGGRLGFNTDIGVMFMGDPAVNVRAYTADPSLSWLQPALNAAVADEERELREEVENFRFYPVIRIGLSYRF